MSLLDFDVVILGSGVAGLCTCVRLLNRKGNLRVALLSRGRGASTNIAALNAVLPNPFGDTVELHAQDTLEAGCLVGDSILVSTMCKEAARGIEFLKGVGIEFASNHGEPLRRRTAGSTFPRSLYQNSGLLGNQMVEKLLAKASSSGMVLLEGYSCERLLVEERRVFGIIAQDCSGAYQIILAPLVVTAWGGIGNLFSESTYPLDVDGRGLAMAFESGASLVDLEFIEFEPTVLIWPLAAKGELFPTALFGEGAYLRNREGDRFLLQVQREGEAGCPKTVLNRAICQEKLEGRGSEHGGVYADLRHLSLQTLKTYSSFYQRLNKVGLDPQRDLLEVAPMPHSHSGGISVTPCYGTGIAGFYAVGEAAGGIHGACRTGGNAATQALVSGLLCAESILSQIPLPGVRRDYKLPEIRTNITARENFLPKVKNIIGRCLGQIRNGDHLQEGLDDLAQIHKSSQLTGDNVTTQSSLSGLLLIQASLFRCESRGNHFRSDYPSPSGDWQVKVEVNRGNDSEINCRKVPLSSGITKSVFS